MSTLTAFDFIPERSEGTPGLWNRIFSTLSDNLGAMQEGPLTPSGSTLSIPRYVEAIRVHADEAMGIGPTPSAMTTGAMTIAVSSGVSDYIHFEDTSGGKSDYLLGSRVGGTADGLNLWDLSGSTMIASFSKQSVRFYQNVVGPVFDIGGALANTLNAATFGTGADSKESRIQAAISAATASGISRVYIPSNMLPYSAASIIFAAAVNMIREGGNAASTDVVAYGAVGGDFPNFPTADSTAAIQAAINSGRDVDFVGLGFQCSNLTQGTTGQMLYSSLGVAYLIKNANGPTITCTGSEVVMAYLNFRGESATPSFTSHNVVATGNNFSMVMCGSRWAYDNAVKVTGGHLQIIDTSDVYQTANSAATSYDIEVGVSGTATLYHRLIGVYTSQHTGGIKFIDTGSQVVTDSTFGKLTIQAGTSPAGVNGGIYVGNRIFGDTSVGLSSAVFSANQFATSAFTILAGVTGVQVDTSNVFQSGATLINSGGASNGLIRSTGTQGFIEIKYGDDSSLAVVKHAAATGYVEFPAWIKIENNNVVLLKQASGADGGKMYMDASNQLWVQNDVSNKNAVLMTAGTGGFVGLAPNQAYAMQINASRATLAVPIHVLAGSALTPSYAFTSEVSLGFYRSGVSTIAQSKGTFWVQSGELWAGSGISVGNATAGGTRIPAISSMSSLVAAFVVQGSASSFTVVTWVAAQPGDQILTTVMPSGAVSSLSSGLVLHSHCTQAGQIEFRLSNVSTLAQNQSSRSYFFTRITPF